MNKLDELHPWWSDKDHETLVAIVEMIQPSSVLEFGSGRSTLSLVQAGVRWIDTFEDNEGWYDINHGMFVDYPAIRHHLYLRRNPLFLPQVQVSFYDLGFVDGPRWVEERESESIYARDHCKAVIFHDWEYDTLQDFAPQVYAGWKVQEYESDPGIIALLTRD